LFAASVDAQAAVVFDTGNELLSMCNDPTDKRICLGTVSGYYDMLQWMDRTCADRTVTMGQAADVVIKFLRDHPASRHLSAASLASAALMQAFPCPKK
jgi:hypothetical protein